MLPEEAPLLADVMRLKSVLRSNMVEGFAILKGERESIKLKQQLHLFSEKIDDLKAELSRMTMQKLKLDKDLRKTREDYMQETHNMREQHKKDIQQALLRARWD